MPQGAILGPLLFVIFVNDLPSSLLECNTYLYVDDTAIKLSARSADDLEVYLNCKLADAAAWMSENHLTLNMEKAKCMLFVTHQSVARVSDVKSCLRTQRLRMSPHTRESS